MTDCTQLRLVGRWEKVDVACNYIHPRDMLAEPPAREVKACYKGYLSWQDSQMRCPTCGGSGKRTVEVRVNCEVDECSYEYVEGRHGAGHWNCDISWNTFGWRGNDYREVTGQSTVSDQAAFEQAKQQYCELILKAYRDCEDVGDLIEVKEKSDE